MQDDDVAVTRLVCRAAPGAIGRTTAAVGVFAAQHGSRPPMLEGVTAAVTEALNEIFDADSARCERRPDTVVDAAADGAWLTVRLAGPGRWPAHAMETHLRDLADRIELSRDERSETMTVLFEFPSNPDRADTRNARDAITAGSPGVGRPGCGGCVDDGLTAQAALSRVRRLRR